MDVAESQEGLELEGGLGRGLDKLVADQDLVGVGYEQDALGENHLAHLVGDLRYGIGLEIDYVLVPARLIDVSIAVDAEVELLAVHNEAFVE